MVLVKTPFKGCGTLGGIIMKFRNKVLSAALGLCFLLPQGSSAVFAKEAISSSPMAQGSLLNIPVVFKEDIQTNSVDLIHNEGEVEKYSAGTLVGYNLNGTVEVKVDDQIVHVEPSTLAISEEEKEKLRIQQEREAEEKNIREDAQAKIAADKKVAANVKDEAVTIDELDEGEEVELEVESTYEWNGPVLTRSAGVNQGPSGKETYYNLPMQGVISIMRSIGNNDEYWVREDGVKMLGDYVMVAAHLPTRPRGSLIPTSLGMGIVCDTGTFALSNHTQLDIAVAW